MRVLVVEDETALQDQLVEVLRQAGYAVDAAGDGLRAEFLGQTETLRRGGARPGAAARRRPDRAAPLARRRPGDAGAGAHRARPLVGQGAGHRRRRRRLPDQAVPGRRAAGPRCAGSSAAPRGSWRRSCASATSCSIPRQARVTRPRRAGAPHRARVAGVRLPDAPPRSRRAAGRAGRAHLRPRRGSRLEHGRGLRRPAAPQARRRRRSRPCAGSATARAPAREPAALAPRARC